MKKVLLLMSLACLFAGCKTFGGSNGETLKLLETTTVVKDLSGNIINLEVVPLTSDSVLLGNVSKLVLTPSGYALLHGGEAFGFGEDGSFLHRFGRAGRGPGEYRSLNDICVSQSGESLLCLTSMNEVISYSLDDGSLEWKTRTDLQGNTAAALLPWKEDSLALFVANPVMADAGDLDKEFNCLKIIDSEGKITHEELLRTDFNVSMGFMSPTMQNAGNTYVLSYLPASGPCYLFDGRGMSELCTLDFGKDALPDKFAFKGYSDPWMSVGDIFEKPYYKCPSTVGVFGDFIFCTAFFENSTVWNFISDGRKGIRWQSVPEQGQPIWPLAADGKYLYYVYGDYGKTDSDDPLKRQLIEGGLVLQPEENPVIVKVEYGLNK